MSNHLHRVLVVAQNREVADRVVGCVAADEAVVRTDFESARLELDRRPPDLIVTEVRLGAFNGLHLAIRARGRGLPTQTILIGEPDCVLEAEARQLHARYLTSPVDEEILAATAHELLSTSDSALPDAPPLVAAANATRLEIATGIRFI